MMDTQIFKLGLSVNALSLYILVCDMASGGVRPTMEAVRGRFNLGEEDTSVALAELLRHKVLYESQAAGSPSFHPNPASLWEVPEPDA